MPSKRKTKVIKKVGQTQKQSQVVNVKINSLDQKRKRVYKPREPTKKLYSGSPSVVYQPSNPVIQYVQPNMTPFSHEVNNPVREDLRLGKKPMNITETSIYPPMEVSNSSIRELLPVATKPSLSINEDVLMDIMLHTPQIVRTGKMSGKDNPNMFDEITIPQRQFNNYEILKQANQEMVRRQGIEKEMKSSLPRNQDPNYVKNPSGRYVKIGGKTHLNVSKKYMAGLKKNP